jgi:hypothetical protein
VFGATIGLLVGVDPDIGDGLNLLTAVESGGGGRPAMVALRG